MFSIMVASPFNFNFPFHVVKHETCLDEHTLTSHSDAHTISKKSPINKNQPKINVYNEKR